MEERKDELISDVEIAETLQALREATLEIPQDLHEQDEKIEESLRKALEEQERLREKLRQYQETEADLLRHKELMELAMEALGDDVLTKEEKDALLGNIKKEEEAFPETIVRVSVTGQVLTDDGSAPKNEEEKKKSQDVVKKKKGNSIFSQMINHILAPMLILFAALIAFVLYTLFARVKDEVRTELEHCADTFQVMLSSKYPGDAEVVFLEGDSYAVCLGDHVLNEEDSLVLDDLREETGIEYSYIYSNTRILTSLMDGHADRLSGTTISSKVAGDVYTKKSPVFYDNVKIEGEDYYAYYLPILDSYGECTAMIGLAKPSSQIRGMWVRSMIPTAALFVVVIAIMGLVIYRYSSRLTGVIASVESFMKRVAGGNISARLSDHVLMRKDEFGRMGKSIVSMQSSLRELIEKDALTTLPNRRYADKQLNLIREKCSGGRIPFCVCIADIDFFKKVNDTYGHECGDVVLKQTALILKKGMRGHGFAARWGGEEFLLIFDGVDIRKAEDILNRIRKEIEAQTIIYTDLRVKRTMSFGVSKGDSSLDNDLLLKQADDCLYYAKESGRNRVITTDKLPRKEEEV